MTRDVAAALREAARRADIQPHDPSPTGLLRDVADLLDGGPAAAAPDPDPDADVFLLGRVLLGLDHAVPVDKDGWADLTDVSDWIRSIGTAPRYTERPPGACQSCGKSPCTHACPVAILNRWPTTERNPS